MKLIYTPAAQKDLRSIGHYTQKNWGLKQRDAYIEKIVEACEGIRKAPEKGKSHPEICNGLRGVRVEKHIVFYKAGQHKKQKAMYIIGILHERMEPSLHLRT